MASFAEAPAGDSERPACASTPGFSSLLTPLSAVARGAKIFKTKCARGPSALLKRARANSAGPQLRTPPPATAPTHAPHRRAVPPRRPLKRTAQVRAVPRGGEGRRPPPGAGWRNRTSRVAACEASRRLTQPVCRGRAPTWAAFSAAPLARRRAFPTLLQIRLRP